MNFFLNLYYNYIEMCVVLPVLFFILQMIYIKFIYNNFTCAYDDQCDYIMVIVKKNFHFIDLHKN